MIVKISLDAAEKNWLKILGVAFLIGGIIYYVNSLIFYQAIVTDDVVGNSTFDKCERDGIKTCSYYEPKFNFEPQAFNHFLSRPTKCCEPTNSSDDTYVVKRVWNSKIGIYQTGLRLYIKNHIRAYENRDVCYLVS